VKYQTAPAFEVDFARLNKAQRAQFMKAVVDLFEPACNAFVASGAQWPARLRVKAVHGAPGILEMTWSFAGADGRATWEWHTLPDGDPCVRWRRIGTHRILSSP
jgi:hypothetical protein